MTCDPAVLKDIPLFALLDDDELGVLAAQVELSRHSLRESAFTGWETSPYKHTC